MSFDQSNSAGNKITAESLQSPNYAQGSSGWTINRDGSAEFQNVLVRGTITASTITGSTITGSTIIGGDIQSSNFSNVTNTGFDLNANATPDAAGTPGNTIQIYSNFLVGPYGLHNGNGIALAYTTGSAVMAFSTGQAADTIVGGIGSTVASPFGVTTGNISIMQMDAFTEANGTTLFNLYSSASTSGSPGGLQLYTVGTTIPTGQLIKARLQVGSTSGDYWNLGVWNTHSILASTGPATFGQPPIIIGDVTTPGFRMFQSYHELMSVDGSGNILPLHLNEDQTGVVAGGLSAAGMRSFGNRNTGGVTYNGTAFSKAIDCPITINLPPSGALLISQMATIIYTGNSKTFFQDFYIFNNTSSTAVYNPSTNNGICYNGGTASQTIRLSATTVAASALGNAGDSITIGLEQEWSASPANGSTNIEQVWLTVTPIL